MPHITEHSIVVARDRQVSSDLGEEAVILHLDSGVYYSLNAVGAAIWSHLREPKAVREIEEAILAEFDVDAERCHSDLIALLHRLEAEDLIEVRETGGGGHAAGGEHDAGRAHEPADR